MPSAMHSDELMKMLKQADIISSFDQEDFEAAEESLNQYRSAYGHDEFYYTYSTELAIIFEDVELTQELLEYAQEDGIESPLLGLQAVRVSLIHNDLPGAWKALERIDEQSFPEVGVPLLRMKGMLQALDGSFREAAETLEDAQMEQEDEPTEGILGLLYFLQKKTERSEELLKPLLEDEEFHELIEYLMDEEEVPASYDEKWLKAADRTGSNAEKLLVSMIRFSFGLSHFFENNGEEGEEGSHLDQIIEEKPQETIWMIQQIISETGDSISAYQILAECYSRLKDRNRMRWAYRKILTYPFTEAEMVNEEMLITSLGLRLHALEMLEYTESTNRKHLIRLSDRFGSSLMARLILVAVCEDRNLDDLEDSLLFETKGLKFRSASKENRKLFFSCQSKFLRDHSRFEELYDHLMSHRKQYHGREDSRDLVDAAVCTGRIGMAEKIAQDFMPDAVMGGILLAAYLLLGEDEKFQKLGGYFLSIPEEIKDDPAYHFLLETFFPEEVAEDPDFLFLQNSQLEIPDEVYEDLNELESYDFDPMEEDGLYPDSFNLQEGEVEEIYSLEEFLNAFENHENVMEMMVPAGLDGDPQFLEDLKEVFGMLNELVSLHPDVSEEDLESFIEEFSEVFPKFMSLPAAAGFDDLEDGDEEDDEDDLQLTPEGIGLLN